MICLLKVIQSLIQQIKQNLVETQSYPFGVDIIKMVLDELHGGVEVSLVELIGDVPANGSKLASLLHGGVEEGNTVQHGLPHGHVAVLQLLLM